MGLHFKIYRLYYTVFAFLGFAGIIYYQLSITSTMIFKVSFLTQITGSLIIAAGFLIMAVCIRKYFMQLSGLRGLIENRINNKLMITGIHKYVRHPLYAGTFLFIWGLWIYFPYWSLLVSNIIITIYTLIGIQFEENKLVKEFGQPYKNYKEKVPMIIPTFIPTSYKQ